MTTPLGSPGVSWLRPTLLIAIFLYTACSSSGPTPTSPEAAANLSSNQTVTFSGAGDIVGCDYQDAAKQTAAILDGIEGLIFTTGDNVYDFGTPMEYEKCYDPIWGRHKARTRPSPGNHDYYATRGTAYFQYFGENAGPFGLGYYAFKYGEWQIYSLNSNVPANLGSAQANWLLNELRSKRSKCTLAYWHHPVFSSGYEGNMPNMRDIWRMLSDFKTDVVLVGHSHNYERFGKQDADGAPSPNGIRSFVVGTGGRSYTDQETIKFNSEVYSGGTFGILKFILRPTSYDWEFIPVPGKDFKDSGSDVCH